jgi:hypothetical protein
MAETNDQYTYFVVTDSFDPADITNRLGVEPTSSWQRGDLDPRTKQPRKFSRWSLHSRLERSAALEDHIRDVLAQLDQDEKIFQRLSREFGGCMQLVAYLRVQYPGPYFEHDIVEDVAKYSLSVDFDFYYLCPDEEE